MEEKPLISIIIPVYNSAKTLVRALDSVEGQSLGLPLEIILPLDPGIDNSLELATQYASTHPNVHLYAPAERMGLGLSRMKGLELAQGDFLYFMDADDRLDPNGLKTLYETLLKTGADCVNCGFYLVSANERSRRFPLHANKTMDASQALSAFFADSWFRGFLWTKMFRRSVTDQRPLLVLTDRQDMFEDVALDCSLLSHCQKVVSISAPLYYYYKDVPTSASTARRSDRALQHLKVVALERYFLEQSGNKSLQKAFKKHLIRTHWSLLFDLRLDKKYGASNEYRDHIKKEWEFLKNMKKPLPVEGRAYEDAIKTSFYF
jgi:glycosyltransferase involved in cell wall biosynthesis